MSRDLKQEYEAMLDQEIPDLWSRIEPRLTDKTSTQSNLPGSFTEAGSVRTDNAGMEKSMQDAQNAEMNAGQQKSGRTDAQRQGAGTDAGQRQDAGADAGQQETIRPNAGQRESIELETVRQKARTKENGMRKRRIRRSTIAVWGSLAAACVCLALILPAWRGSKKGIGGTNQMWSENNYASDMAAEDTAVTGDSTAAETETAEDGAMASKDELQSEEGTMNGMAPAESPAESYDGLTDDADMAGMESAEPENVTTAADDAAQTDGAEADCGSSTESIAAVPEESVPEQENERGSGADLQYECYGEIVDAWRTDEGFFYRMELVFSASEALPDGTEILIWQKAGLLSGLPGIKGKALTTGECYTVVVEPEVVDGETRYVLIGYEADDGNK